MSDTADDAQREFDAAAAPVAIGLRSVVRPPAAAPAAGQSRRGQGGALVTFSENELRNLLWCCGAVLRGRRAGILPGGEQRWLRELARRVELELAASSSRQDSDRGEQYSDYDRWIGSQQTAAILGRDLRWVQRHAAELGGRKVAGALVFRESTIRHYAEDEMSDGCGFAGGGGAAGRYDGQGVRRAGRQDARTGRP